MKLKDIIPDLIFNKSLISEIKTKNWEKIVKFCSNQLIIPSLYLSIKNLKEINAPADLLFYCKEIFEINRERNLKLCQQIDNISLILNANKINYVFIKGSSLIIKGLYPDLERMVGDIDILVDNSQFNLAIELLKKNGYNSRDSIIFSFQKHYPRLLKKDNLFAVEIHRELLDYKKELLDCNKILENKIYVDSKPIPSEYYQILNAIYNFQINDFGYNTCNFSYKTLIDIDKIYSKGDNFKLPINKYTKRFQVIGNIHNEKLRLFDKKIKENWIFLIRIKMKEEFQIYNRLDYVVTYNLSRIKKRIKQILEVVNNPLYRNHLINNQTK